jgi:hypothetical protein
MNIVTPHFQESCSLWTYNRHMAEKTRLHLCSGVQLCLSGCHLVDVGWPRSLLCLLLSKESHPRRRLEGSINLAGSALVIVTTDSNLYHKKKWWKKHHSRFIYHKLLSWRVSVFSVSGSGTDNSHRAVHLTPHNAFSGLHRSLHDSRLTKVKGLFKHVRARTNSTWLHVLKLQSALSRLSPESTPASRSAYRTGMR